MFSESKAPMLTHSLLCRMLDVWVTLAYACDFMLTGQVPMVIIYASIWLYVYDLYEGGAHHASLGGAHYVSLGGPHYTL